VPLYALWANLHIQFVLGLGVLGLGLAVPIVDRRERKQLLGGFALLAACGFATLLNPYHVRLYQVVWEYATQTGAMRVVSELAPPNFRPWNWWNWALAALLAWAAGMVAARRLPIVDTALLVVGAVFSLRMQRDIWFGAVCAAAVLTRLPAVPRTPGERPQLPGLVIATAAALVLARIIWLIAQGPTIAEKERADYPVGAVEWVRAHRPAGPLYNHFNWGGYLIWALPEYPVGMDGRTNLYGEERLEWAFRAWTSDEGLAADPDLDRAGLVIAPKKLGREDVKLTGLLRAAADRWRVAYEDETAVVFVPR
jgi:hypothetical protein